MVTLIFDTGSEMPIPSSKRLLQNIHQSTCR
jgi:hypothetical protein